MWFNYFQTKFQNHLHINEQQSQELCSKWRHIWVVWVPKNNQVNDGSRIYNNINAQYKNTCNHINILKWLGRHWGECVMSISERSFDEVVCVIFLFPFFEPLAFLVAWGMNEDVLDTSRAADSSNLNLKKWKTIFRPMKYLFNE